MSYLENSGTKEAIVLAGGLGTRLQSVVKDLPKPMAEVAGRHFLDYILFSLAKNQVKQVVLAVGHLNEVIQEHYSDEKNRFGLRISYSIEKELLGTGGAITQAANLIAGESFFVLNGDTYFDIGLRTLENFAQQKGAKVALALKQISYSQRYGQVIRDETDKIISFKEKDSGYAPSLTINGGVYYLHRSALTEFELPAKFSFELDFLQQHISSLQAYGKVFPGTFIDIGIPEDYQTAQTLLQNVIQS
ncbi:nucleotidyltransferase family protein [Botryobacter ruber]|uniref:nucleotidyltransferase family protein n=1 Tax=Botryobacter ruber TaxID=2171629 RepID=UPI000E0B7C3F|nr:nucleotidyltransferase family protein [Botryobacter ruber]